MGDLERRLKAVGMPFVFLAFYFLFGLVLNYIHAGEDAMLITCVLDACASLPFMLYYFDHASPVTKRVGDATHILLFSLFLVFAWVVTQASGTYLQSVVHDPMTDRYLSMEVKNVAHYAMLGCALAPLCEELLFRGIFYRSFGKVMPKVLACVLSSLIFGLTHGTVVHAYVGFVCGVMFCIVYEFTYKLRYCVLFHSAYNMVCFLGNGTTWGGIWQNPVVLFGLNLNLLLGILYFWMEAGDPKRGLALR